MRIKVYNLSRVDSSTNAYSYVLTALFAALLLAPVHAVTLFESDWSTAMGTNQSAIRDTDKARPWDAGTTAAWSALEVVPATGLDFPTTNVLRVKRSPESGGYSWAEIQNIPSLSIGESLYYRVYLRNDVSDSATLSNHHPIETAFGGAYTNGFSWKFGSNGDGTFPLTWNLQTTDNPYPLYAYAKGNPLEPLLIGQTYRIEWGVYKTAVDTYTIDVLVYDSSNTVLWNKTTVRAQGRNDNVGCNYCTLQSVAENRALADSELTKFRVGTNGGTWSALTSEQYFYFGAVAICKNEWCGPYTILTPEPEPEQPEVGVCEATGSGRCFYIDPVNGNDNNNGSFATPWKTGNNTKSTIYGSYRTPGYVQLGPGDIVYLMDGVHGTIINPGHDAGPTAGGEFVFYFRGVSGTIANPITLKAYPDHTPVIEPASQGIGVYLENANHWRMEGFTIRAAYERGLRLYSVNGFVASNLHIYDTDGIDNNNIAGIVTNTLYNAVFEYLDMHDNFDRLAADTGGVGGENSANIVFFQGGNVTVRHSRFYHTRLNEQYQTCVKYKHGIPVATDWFEVYNNTFENCRIYGLASDSANTYVHHNVFMHGAGIASQNLGSSTTQSVNVLFEYNTLYNTTPGGLSLVPRQNPTAQFPDGPKNMTYRNNIVYDLRSAYNTEFGIINIGTYLTDALYTLALPELTIDDNCYYNPAVSSQNIRFNFAAATNFGPLGALYLLVDWQALGFDTSSVFSNPLFVDVGARDFRLQAGSPCSAMGVYGTPAAPVPILPVATVSHNFNDGTIGPFTNPWATSIDFPDDPTGSNRGKIARIRYAPASGSSDGKAVTYSTGTTKLRYGQTVWMKGDVYLPSTAISGTRNTAHNRKLIDYQGGGVRMTLHRVNTNGDLRLSIVDSTATGTEQEVIAESTSITLADNTWHTIEVRMTTNSADGVQDGILEVYINEETNPRYRRTNGLKWITENFIGPTWAPANGSYFKTYMTGFQLTINSGDPVYEEYRYWDNIYFGPTRAPAQTPPPPTPRVGDLNGDGTVNISDVILIIQNFKRKMNYDTGADINSDGTVNIYDMVLLGRNWGDGTTQTVQPFFEDNFAGPAKNNANGWEWRNGAGGVSIPAVNFAGRDSIRFRFGPDAPGEDSTAEQRFRLGRNLTEVWFEYDVYMPLNYMHRNDSPSNNKFIRIWGVDYNNINKMGASTWYSGSSTKGRLRVDRNTPVGGGIGPGTGGGLYEGSPSVDNPIPLGEWAQVRIHAKMPTSTAANDAEFSVFVNGQAWIDWQNLNAVLDGTVPYWDQGYFFGAGNSGWTEETDIHLSRFKAYDQDPGWN